MASFDAFMIPERISLLPYPGSLLELGRSAIYSLVRSLGLCFCGIALLSYFSLSVTILLDLAGHGS